MPSDYIPLPVVWDMSALGAWQDQANCNGLDVNDFYYTIEDSNRTQRRAKERAALKVCANCSVKQQCLDDAIIRDDAHSIQGGTTPKMRGHRTYIVEADLATGPISVVQATGSTRKETRHAKAKAPSIG